MELLSGAIIEDQSKTTRSKINALHRTLCIKLTWKTTLSKSFTLEIQRHVLKNAFETIQETLRMWDTEKMQKQIS